MQRQEPPPPSSPFVPTSADSGKHWTSSPTIEMSDGGKERPLLVKFAAARWSGNRPSVSRMRSASGCTAISSRITGIGTPPISSPPPCFPPRHATWRGKPPPSASQASFGCVRMTWTA